jgi:hypothetical protein
VPQALRVPLDCGNGEESQVTRSRFKEMRLLVPGFELLEEAPLAAQPNVMRHFGATHAAMRRR